MKKNTLHIILLIFFPFLCFAQNIDSLKKATKSVDKKQRITALIALGKYQLYSNTEASEQNFKTALKEVKDFPNKKFESDILNQLGVIQYKKSQFDSALVYYKKSYTISEKLQDSLQMAINYSNVANILRAQAKYDLAIQNFLKALKIYEKEGNELYQAMTFGAIGTLHLSLDEYAKAKPYFEKTLVILKKIKNVHGVLTTQLNIAICLSNLNKHNEAEKLLLTLIKEAQKYKYSRIYAIALSKLGKIYLHEKNYEKAKKSFTQAKKEFSKANDIGGLAETHLFLGKVTFELKQFKKSLKHYKESIAFTEKSGVGKKSPEAIKGVIKNLKKLHKEQETIPYYDLLLTAKDTIFNIERRKITTEINTKFDVAQKEKEIQIKQLEIDKKDAQLSLQKQFVIGLGILTLSLIGLLYFVRKSNKYKRLNEYNLIRKNKLELEQKVLSNQMNPHFIFNALNSIQSYVSDNNTTNAEIYLAKFSRLIRIILENSRKEFVPFKEDYFALDSYLKLEQNRFDHSFDYKISYPNEFEEICVPPMMIQPFVENAIKHGIASLKEQGNISIEYSLTESINENEYGIITCTITDNGIGLEEAKKKKKEKMGNHNSLSMTLTKERLENYTTITQINYKMIVTSNTIGTGTTVIIEMPYTI